MKFDSKSPRTHNRQPNYNLKRATAAVALGVIAFVGVKGYETLNDSIADRNTIDDISFSGVAHTVPNPTIGGKEALREMLQSSDPATVEAASRVDATELGDEITRAVFAETGEDSHGIKSNYSVEFKIEADGDVVSAEVITDFIK